MTVRQPRMLAGRPGGRRFVVGRLAVAAVAVALTAGLAGCDAARPGAGAVIGGDAVPVTRVQDLARDLRAANATVEAAEAPRIALTRLIYSRIFADMAAQRGLTPSQGEVDAFLARFQQDFPSPQEAEQFLAQRQFVPPSYRAQWARDVVAQLALGRALVPGSDDDQAVQQRRNDELGKLFQEHARRLDVDVNPRFGSWSADALEVTADDGRGLSKPVPGPATPTPSAPPQPEPQPEPSPSPR